MRKICKLMVLSALATATIPFAATANDGQDKDHHNNGHHIMKVALWGDEFYSDDPQTKSDMIDQTIASMNSDKLDFTIFVGDTKNGSSLCTDQAIGQDVITIFNRLDVPTLYSVGDNEWTDCHRTNNGSYDPLERLRFLRSTFFNKDTTQGPDPIQVKRQGALGEAYSENRRFVKHNVEFVALHIPGSNNNLVVTDDQCFKNSNRTQADCDAAAAEYQARNVQNIAWLKEAFAEANSEKYAGVLIAIQADIYFPFELSGGGYREGFLPQLDANNGYADFFNTLVEETQSFEGKVVLVRGDSHYFKYDKAMYNEDGTLTGNYTRIEVFGNADNSWVEMTVDPSSKNVFSIAPIVLN
jgi:hypothetical protein